MPASRRGHCSGPRKSWACIRAERGGGTGSHWLWALPSDEALLRHVRERDQAERLGEIRREIAHATPGDRWTPPARDHQLYLDALQERGLIVVQLLGLECLLRTEDTVRLPLVEQLVHDCAEGDVAAEAALRDLFIELGSTADGAAILVAALGTTAFPDGVVAP
jgi:hypothetical protein